MWLRNAADLEDLACGSSRGCGAGAKLRVFDIFEIPAFCRIFVSILSIQQLIFKRSDWFI